MYDTRLLQFPAHVDESHGPVSSDIGEGMEASIVVCPVPSVFIGTLADLRRDHVAWFLLRLWSITFGGGRFYDLLNACRRLRSPRIPWKACPEAGGYCDEVDCMVKWWLVYLGGLWNGFLLH